MARVLAFKSPHHQQTDAFIRFIIVLLIIKPRVEKSMGKHRKRLLDGGLVFFFALALTRRCKSHYAINEAIDWLEEQGHTRQAKQLLEASNGADNVSKRSAIIATKQI
jgi:hypothetical protein